MNKTMYSQYRIPKKLPKAKTNVNFDRKDIEKISELIRYGVTVSQIAALALHVFLKSEKSSTENGHLIVKFSNNDYSGESLVPFKVRLITEDVEKAEKLSKLFGCSFSVIVRYAFHCYVKELPMDKILNNDRIFK